MIETATDFQARAIREASEAAALAAWLDYRWSLRDAEYVQRHGVPAVKGKWPIVRAAELVSANVQPIRKKAGK